MNKPLRYLLQAFNYTIFMAIIWYFSLYPAYHYLEEDQAMITFTVSHTGKYIRECIKFSQQELLKLAPNMRKPMDCPRERSPVIMELKLDDKVIYSKVAQPRGLYSDQGIDVYQNIRVPAGNHRLTAWLNDDVKVEGPIYRLDQAISIAAEQHMIVEFKPAIARFDVY